MNDKIVEILASNDDNKMQSLDKLLTNNNVQTIRLKCSNIGDNGATSLAKTLKYNSTVRTIFLFGNF